MRFFIYPVVLFSLLFSLSCASSKKGLDVERLKLDNGMTFLLVKRPGAPVFSAYVRVKVGGLEETPGSTGLAHFFEHMAFKGTPTIGTKDYAKEKVVLKELGEAGKELTARLEAGEPESSLQSLKDHFQELQNEAQSLVERNEFVGILQRNGGADLNATTTNDYTSYYVSLPVSKLELWAYMESERLLHPVLREFYKERDVVTEERRMRFENSPDGRLYEAFMNTSFDVSPYGTNVIGVPQDIQNYTMDLAQAFRDRYYIPSRMVVALVGNFNVWSTKRMLKKYFGQLQDKKDEPRTFPSEPLNNFPREKTLTGQDNPRFYLGFHRPAYPHPDDEVFDIINHLLCEGRSSRLYLKLVTRDKLASAVDCYASLPGARLDNLFSFYALPLAPHSNKEVEASILAELNDLKTNLVSDEELKKVENQIDAEMVWSLKSNMGLAGMLTYFESLTGDWHYLYQLRDKIHAITAADVQRVIRTYFIPERQVQVFLEEGKGK